MNIQKISTNNIPLLDEIIYYTKILAIGTVLKDEDLALKNETSETLKNSDIYIACLEGKSSIYMFDYTKEDLILSGILETDPNMNRYLSKSDYIPDENKTKLLKVLTENFINNYEEQNNYYRTLYGLPDYIEKFIPNKYFNDIELVDENGIIDYSKPLHRFSSEEIEVLESLDVVLEYSGKENFPEVGEYGNLYVNILDTSKNNTYRWDGTQYYNSEYIFKNILKDTDSRLVEWETKMGSNVTSNKAICYNEWDYIPDDLKGDAEIYSIPSNLPMHFYSVAEASSLEFIGVIDYFKEEYPDKKYIDFITEKKVAPYEARKTVNFGILYIPRILVTEIHNKYYERVVLNRDFVIRSVHSEAYKLKSTHYNDFIKLYIIVLSMADMISSSTEFLIRRELFDIRTIEYLLTSYGVTFFSNIPLRYQQKIVKKLNSLLKYKSSPRCMEIINALFDVDDIKIYNYYLIKTRVMEDDNDDVFRFTDPTNIRLFHTANGEDLGGVYELEDKTKTGNDRKWICYYTNENNTMIKSYIQHSSSDHKWILYNKNNERIASLEDPKKLGNESLYEEIDPVGDWIIETSDISESVYSRFTDTEVDDYELKFCKVLLNDHLEDYINNEDYYKDYDIITDADQYWNGDESAELVKNNIMAENFNFIRTKYISVDVIYDLTQLSVQRPYLYGMIFDEEERPATIEINVDAISTTKSFKLNDLICYLLSLSFKVYGIKDVIPTSKEDIMKIVGFDFDAAIEDLQKYMFENEITDVDLSEFSPTGPYTTFTELMNYYNSDRDLRSHLVYKMENADNKRMYDIYKTIYDFTMLQEQTNNLFIESDNMDYEESDDIILYNKVYGNKEPYVNKDTYTKVNDKEWKLNTATISYSELDKEWQLKDSNTIIATLPDFENPIGYWNSKSNTVDSIYTRFTNETKDSKVRYTTYQDFIESRDPVLAKSLSDIDALTDETTKLDIISNIILSSIEALEVIYSDPKEPYILKYIFSNLGSVSLEATTIYIKQLIEFFMSFTVQINEMNSLLKMGTPFDNKLSPIDGFKHLISKFRGTDIIEIQDQVNQILSTNTLGDKITILDRVYIDPIYDDE